MRGRRSAPRKRFFGAAICIVELLCSYIYFKRHNVHVLSLLKSRWKRVVWILSKSYFYLLSASCCKIFALMMTMYVVSHQYPIDISFMLQLYLYFYGAWCGFFYNVWMWLERGIFYLDEHHRFNLFLHTTIWVYINNDFCK